VEARNFDLARVDRFENSRKKADANAVAQFGILKAEIANLAQHGPAIGVPARIPTSRK
jgi:hypothetical protein